MPKKTIVPQNTPQMIQHHDSLQRKEILSRKANHGNPLSVQFWNAVSIPNTDSYFCLWHVRYKTQSSFFYIVFSHEFATQSLALEDASYEETEYKLAEYINHFFEKDYIVENKGAFFKYPEYFLVFTCVDSSEFDRAIRDLCKYLQCSKKDLHEWRNLVSLWDSFPSIVKIIKQRKWVSKRWLKGLSKFFRKWEGADRVLEQSELLAKEFVSES